MAAGMMKGHSCVCYCCQASLQSREGARFLVTDIPAAPSYPHLVMVWEVHSDSVMAAVFTAAVILPTVAREMHLWHHPFFISILPPLLIPICPPSAVLMCMSLRHPSVLSRQTFV